MTDPAATGAPSKAQRKQQERTRESLAFLARVQRVRVTRNSFLDEHEQIHFDVIMKASGASATPLSARATRKDARAIQPTVDYANKKSLSTLKGVHVAVHQWSTKHREATVLCAYCSQFNAPAALQLWKWDEPQAPTQQETTQYRGATLTVVVNNNNSSSNSTLSKYEKCLNSYLESARAVAATDESSVDALQCEGRAHIPSLVASFLQNEASTSVAVSVALFSCLVM